MCVVVISFGPGPVIWIVSVVVNSTFVTLPCHIDCECGGHQMPYEL